MIWPLKLHISLSLDDVVVEMSWCESLNDSVVALEQGDEFAESVVVMVVVVVVEGVSGGGSMAGSWRKERKVRNGGNRKLAVGMLFIVKSQLF